MARNLRQAARLEIQREAHARAQKPTPPPQVPDQPVFEFRAVLSSNEFLERTKAGQDALTTICGSTIVGEASLSDLRRFLSQHQSQINSQDAQGRLLLNCIIKGLGEKELGLPAMELAIESGADVNTCDRWGDNALHQASARDVWCKPALIKYLLSHGADCHAVNLGGNTAIKLAEQKNQNNHRDEIVALLKLRCETQHQ